MPPAGGQSRRRRAIVNLIEASSLIRLGCFRNLNLGPEASQAQLWGGSADPLASASGFS
jgi:hypothetical protein